MDKIQKIKKLLKVNNLTYEQFAKQIGKSKQTVVNWFNGRGKIDIDTIEKIAQVLGVPVSYFFGESGGSVINNGIAGISGINHGRIDIRISEQRREIEKLRAELSGCREVLKAKEQMIEQLKEMIEILRERG